VAPSLSLEQEISPPPAHGADQSRIDRIELWWLHANFKKVLIQSKFSRPLANYSLCASLSNSDLYYSPLWREIRSPDQVQFAKLNQSKCHAPRALAATTGSSESLTRGSYL
jgi:hypothetical protein